MNRQHNTLDQGRTMGSSQSKSNTAVEPTLPSTALEFPSESLTSNEADNTKDTTTSKRHKSKDDEAGKNLSGFDLVNYKCRRKEKAYKKCVSKYYSNIFLSGQSLDQEEACGELFERYRRCYLRGVQKEVWGKDSPPPAKNSVLAIFAEEEEEDEEVAMERQSRKP